VYALSVRARVGIALVFSIGIVAGEARAQAVDRSVCVAAAERGQELQNAKKLRDARGQFALCARDECPAAVSAECKRWRAEAEAALGSVLLEVVDAKGARVTKARVLVDGAVWTDEVPPDALFLDPGSHEIKIERAGGEAVVRNVTLAMGERDRVVKATLGDLDQQKDASKQGDAATKKPSSSTPVLPIVLGVAGVAAAGTGVAFWLAGNADLDDAKERCRAGCPDSEADSARTKHLIGDVAMGVAAVAIGAAIVLWITRDKAPATAFSFRPRSGFAGDAPSSFRAPPLVVSF
jgi:hypothetical protein